MHATIYTHFLGGRFWVGSMAMERAYNADCFSFPDYDTLVHNCRHILFFFMFLIIYLRLGLCLLSSFIR
jgi:hypothetical protein